MTSTTTTSTTTTTNTIAPAAAIRSARPRSFVRLETLPGTAVARRKAASRAVADGDLINVRHGLYYRGAKTRYGMTRPSAVEVALETLGRKGVGPAGFSAAREWSLTTQVPPTLRIAGLKPAKDVPGITVTLRSNLDRVGLTYKEIALVELLRDPEAYVEHGWAALLDAVAAAESAREVRVGKVLSVAATERDVATRTNAARMREELKGRSGARQAAA